MNLIFNACHAIANMLKETSSGSADGADTFVPATIYLVLQLSHEAARSLYSQAQYIRLFRHPSKIIGETDYYLTVFQSNLEYISNLSSSDFVKVMEESEYSEKIRMSKQEVQETDLLGVKSDTVETLQDSEPVLSPAVVEALNEIMKVAFPLKDKKFDELQLGELKDVWLSVSSLLEASQQVNE